MAAPAQDGTSLTLPLHIPRPSSSVYANELTALKEKQNRWREKHDEFMERKRSKQDAAGTLALPPLHPLLNAGARATPSSRCASREPSKELAASHTPCGRSRTESNSAFEPEALQRLAGPGHKSARQRDIHDLSSRGLISPMPSSAPRSARAAGLGGGRDLGSRAVGARSLQLTTPLRLQHDDLRGPRSGRSSPGRSLSPQSSLRIPMGPQQRFLREHRRAEQGCRAGDARLLPMAAKAAAMSVGSVGRTSSNSIVMDNNFARSVHRQMSRTLSRGPSPEASEDASDDDASASGDDSPDHQASPETLDRRRLASKQKAIEEWTHGRLSEFDVCVQQAKKHRLPIDTVKRHYEEFVALDENGNGILAPGEFEAAVRKLCHVADDQPTPKHLFDNQWKLLDKAACGFAKFEEFLLWSVNVAFTQEVAVEDASERSLRDLARKHGFNLLDVERMRGVFAKFDADGSGEVDIEEFKNVLCSVMKVKEASDIPDVTVKRYFREVDIDGSGDISFEEFATWYLAVHNAHTKQRQR